MTHAKTARQRVILLVTSWSPFGGGGLNAYMYCVGDPVNRADPTGHITVSKFFSNFTGFLFGGANYTGSKGVAAVSPEMLALSPMTTAKDFSDVVVAALDVGARAPYVKTGMNGPKPNYPSQGAYSRQTPKALTLTTLSSKSSESPQFPPYKRPTPTATRSSFDEPRTVWKGEQPKPPVFIHERLLGSEAPTVKNPVVDAAYPIHAIRRPEVLLPPLIVVHPAQ